MEPKFSVRRDNSGAITFEATIPPDHAAAIAGFLDALTDALRSAVPENGKSDASKSLAYADVPDSIADVSYLSHRRQLMWALLRIVRSAEVDQADTRPLDEIITDTALELGIEPNDAQIVYPAKRRTQAKKLRRRRDREILKLHRAGNAQAQIADLIDARPFYGPVSQSTVSRVIRGVLNAESARAAASSNNRVKNALTRLSAATTYPNVKASDNEVQP